MLVASCLLVRIQLVMVNADELVLQFPLADKIIFLVIFHDLFLKIIKWMTPIFLKLLANARR